MSKLNTPYIGRIEGKYSRNKKKIKAELVLYEFLAEELPDFPLNQAFVEHDEDDEDEYRDGYAIDKDSEVDIFEDKVDDKVIDKVDQEKRDTEYELKELVKDINNIIEDE